MNNIVFTFSTECEFNNKTSETFSLINDTTNIVSEEKIEDTDEYLNINNTATHVNINKIAQGNDKANKIPKYVATPFPPLNLSQTGKMCAKKVTKADK